MGCSVSKIRHYLHDRLFILFWVRIISYRFNYNYWNWSFHGSFVLFFFFSFLFQFWSVLITVCMLGKRECSMWNSIYIPASLCKYQLLLVFPYIKYARFKWGLLLRRVKQHVHIFPVVPVHRTHMFSGALLTCFTFICHKSNVTLSGGKGLVSRSLSPTNLYSTPNACRINFTRYPPPLTTLTRSLLTPLVGAMGLLRFDSFPNKLVHW